jgi:type II secretory pathway pseudopilin PulG
MKKKRTPFVCDVARGDERAFTLLDLMVVIATLAILAALMLPALGRSDDHGTRMVCLNNLRQMGMAANMYVADNRDYFPYANWDGGNGGSPAGWLYTVTSGLIPNPVDNSPWKANPITAWRTGLWFQYVQNTKAYLCPVDIESKTYTTPPASGGREEKLSTYVMNGAVVGFPGSISTYGTPCKITDAWSPACYLLWEPDENSVGLGNPGAFDYNDGADFPNTSEGIGRLHSTNSGDLLCVGGNVQLVTTLAFKKQTVVGSGPGPGGKTLAWWDSVSSNGD